jgi:uncharacterized protein DUF4169
MSEIVNFRRTKKAKERAAKDAQAAGNRVHFGTPKALRKLNKARSEKAGKDQDAHKLDGKPSEP